MLLAAFRLAFYFRRPVSELNISLREFYHWLHYLKLEPPDEGERQRFAALMAQMTNMSGKSLKQGHTVTADDFLGKPKEIKRQTAEEQIAFMKGLKGNK